MDLGVDIPILLALFAFATQGTSDFWLKHGVVREGDPFSIMALTVPTFALTSAASGAVLGGLEFSAPTFGYGVLIGALSFIAMNLFVASLREGEASVNTMLFRLNFIVASLLSITILGESAGWAKWLGLALAAGAVCSVALGGGQHGEAGSRRAVSLATAALICYGFNGFFIKVASLREVKAPALAVVTSCSFGLLSAALHYAPRGGFRIQSSALVLKYGLVSGFLQALAFNAILWSMVLGGEASVVIPILQLSFVWTAALAVFGFKEPVNARKGLGFLLAVLALAVLAL